MTGTAVRDVFGWRALDSRGTPTVGCQVTLVGGAAGDALVPSGASTGRHEAHELRDGGDRYGGRDVTRAVANVRGELRAAVLGLDAADQEELDRALRAVDGSADLSRLGANAVLAVSIAAARAAAAASGVPLYRRLDRSGEPVLLPLPMVNVLSGGAHAGGALDIQDVLVVPVGAGSFSEAIEWAWRVRRAAAELADERGLPAALVADEGGLGLRLPSNRSALELVSRAIERAGLAPGTEAAVAVDVAASQLVRDGRYALAGEGRALDVVELVAEVEAWCRSFPLVSVEDPLAEDDWAGWRAATRVLGPRVQLIGDDLLATSRERLERALAEDAGNAVLVKPNQTGTLSAARDVLERAREGGWRTIVSARSGDTEDSWLADLAVGWRAGQIKVGSVMRSERTAKWNRLLRIEAELGGGARLARPFERGDRCP